MKSKSGNKPVPSNIEVVLVQPNVPENIGLVARVLKNTSFSNLSIVTSHIPSKSFEVAKRARDILDKARVVTSLNEALNPAAFVFGTTRRKRAYTHTYNFNDIKLLVVSLAQRQKVSVLFGTENFGLSKEEISLCDSVFYLPADEGFPSYNVSVAVGIVCYELMMTARQIAGVDSLTFAKKKDIATLFSFWEACLRSRVSVKKLEGMMCSLRRIFSRTLLTTNEVSLLKDIAITLSKDFSGVKK